MFNMKEWCPLHRSATKALRDELSDLRSFVRQNVLDADAAARVEAKIGKTCAKLDSVEASSESLILAYEADCGGAQGGPGCDRDSIGSTEGIGSGSGGGSGTSEPAKEPQVIGSGDVGTLPTTIAATAASPTSEKSPAGDTTGEAKQG